MSLGPSVALDLFFVPSEAEDAESSLALYFFRDENADESHDGMLTIVAAR